MCVQLFIMTPKKTHLLQHIMTSMKIISDVEMASKKKKGIVTSAVVVNDNM